MKSSEFLTDQELNQKYRKQVMTGRAMASPLLPEKAKGIRADIVQSKPEQLAGWDVRHAELVEYAREHRNTNVSYRYEKNLALGRWVSRQQKLFQQNKLSEEQISRLCKLDFKFSMKEQVGWVMRYAELVPYVRKHGNTNVPDRYEKNLALGRWVTRQRNMFKQNKLAKKQMSRLQKLDLKFSVREQSRWDVIHAELVE